MSLLPLLCRNNQNTYPNLKTTIISSRITPRGRKIDRTILEINEKSARCGMCSCRALFIPMSRMETITPAIKVNPIERAAQAGSARGPRGRGEKGRVMNPGADRRTSILYYRDTNNNSANNRLPSCCRYGKRRIDKTHNGGVSCRK